jgi:hypothetical protein
MLHGSVFRSTKLDGPRGFRAQRASSGAAISNWYWPCERTHSQGVLKRRYARDLSLSLGAALCAQNQGAGSSHALAVSQRCFKW